MLFQLFGEVRASAGGVDLPLGTPQQRGLLALLLLRDAPVAIDAAVDALWGDQPPRSARGTVRTYAARLRQVLGDAVPLRRSAPATACTAATPGWTWPSSPR